MSEKSVTPVVDPGLQAGNHVSVPLEALHTQMAEVVPMLEADDQIYHGWVDEYVERRANELSSSTTIANFGGSVTSTREFLSPKVDMNIGSMYRSYHLDDNSAYEAAFDFFKTEHNGLKERLSPEAAYINAAIQAAGRGQAAYFKSLIGNHMGRQLIATDFIDDDAPDRNSIADFKNVAMCLERAAVAHNILKILGIDSQLESGKVAVQEADGSFQEESHAFLTVVGSDGETRFIFDPTNPIVFRDKDGKIVDHKPALYKIEQPDAQQLTSGLREYWQQPDGNFGLSQTREITYTFPKA